MSIKAKLSIGLSLILVVAFFAINLLNYNVSRSALRQSMIDEALPGISNDIYQAIQRDLIIPLQVSSLMANDTFLKDWVLNGEQDISKIKKYLWEIKERYGFFSTFLVSGWSNNYYHYKGINKKISPDDDHDVWYYSFISSGKDYVLDVDTDEVTKGTLTIFINHRLTDYQGNLLGVTGVGLKMSDIGRLLDGFQERYGKQVYLVDRNGLIQVHPNQDLILKENIEDKPGMRDVVPAMLQETASKPVVKEYDAADGEHRLLIARYIPEFDWFLMVEHNEGQDLKEIRATFFRNLLIGLAVTVLVIVINILMVNYFQGKLESLAATDELTGLPNRRSFLDQAKREVANASRAGQPVSMLMIDVDHFKEVNDQCGHDVGDYVLKQMSGLMGQALRQGDLAGRLGGEEFAVLLPRTAQQAANEVAERLRGVVEQAGLPAGYDGCNVTVSVGIAVEDGKNNGVEGLMKRADDALYRAKTAGRNMLFVS